MGEIQSLARGLKILELMGEYENGISITNLALLMEVNKATASRLVKTLQHYGFVEKAPDRRLYRLGPMVVNLSRGLINRMPLRETAKPFLKKLVELSGECAHLAIYAQGKALYIDQVESPATVRVNVEVGQMAPLHCTALGKVLLAFGEFPIPDQLEKFTGKTITSRKQLEMMLEKVRLQGYAIDDVEFDDDVRCIAAPVFDYRGKLVGAMGISGPAARLTLDRINHLSPQIIQCAQQLSDRLKFKKP